MSKLLQLNLLKTYFIALLFLCRSSFAQQSTFSKIYFDSTVEHIANDQVITLDGGTMICGKSISQLVATIYKTDSVGNFLWAKQYGSGTGAVFNSIIRTSDSSYVIAGSIYNSSVFSFDFFITKIDSSGNLIWAKQLEATGYQEAMSVRQTLDDGYILTGYRFYSPSPNSKIIVTKLDQFGNIQWYNEMQEGNYENIAVVVKQLPDSNYIIGGFVANTTQLSSNGFLCELSSVGNVIWANKYNQASQEFFRVNDIIQLSDGFITYSENQSTLIIMKTDLQGNVLWSKGIPNYGRSNCTNCIPYSIEHLSNGNILFTAASSDSIMISKLVEIDTSGVLVWAKTIDNYVHSVLESVDHGFNILGNGPLTVIPNSHISLNKTDSLGDAGICTSSYSLLLVKNNVAEVPIVFTSNQISVNSISVYPVVSNVTMNSQDKCGDIIDGISDGYIKAVEVFPNPSNGKVSIRIDGGVSGNHIIRFENMLGQIIFETKFNSDQTHDFNVERELSKGVYVYTIYSENNMFAGKLIVN